jgi:serine O-acetyltransferase
MTSMPHLDADRLLRVPAPGSAAVWDRLRREAEAALSCDPVLAQFLVSSILDRRSFADALIHRIASRLGSDCLPAYQLEDIFCLAVAEDPGIGTGFLRGHRRCARA